MKTAYEIWKDFRFSEFMRTPEYECACGGSFGRVQITTDDPRDSGYGDRLADGFGMIGGE